MTKKKVQNLLKHLVCLLLCLTVIDVYKRQL